MKGSVAVILLGVILVTGCVASNQVRQVSQSMEPTIKKGEIVTIEPVNISQLKVGDIILFQPATVNFPVITRIVILDWENQTFTGKGDANPASNGWEKGIPLDQIMGKVLNK